MICLQISPQRQRREARKCLLCLYCRLVPQRVLRMPSHCGRAIQAALSDVVLVCVLRLLPVRVRALLVLLGTPPWQGHSDAQRPKARGLLGPKLPHARVRAA